MTSICTRILTYLSLLFPLIHPLYSDYEFFMLYRNVYEFFSTDVVGYHNESSMVGDILDSFQNDSSSRKSDILGGIVFHDLSLPDIQYSIRMSSSPRNGPTYGIFTNTDNSGWKTQFQFPMFQMVGPREAGSVTGGSPGKPQTLVCIYVIDLSMKTSQIHYWYSVMAMKLYSNFKE